MYTHFNQISYGGKMSKLIISLLMVALALPAFAEEKPKADQPEGDYKEKVEAQVKAYEDYEKKVRGFEKSGDFKVDLLSKDLPYDVTIGDKNAPVKIVEYASLSCIHCKEFHDNVYYKLKADYIDKGKVYFKYRHFPLNGHALKAATLVGCVSKMEKPAFVGALFKSQNQWGYVKNEAGLIERLKTISKIGGLDSNEFEKCYNDEKSQDKLLELQKDAAKGLNIDATPSIFVNGIRYLGSRNYEDFSKIMDEEIKKVEKLKGKTPAKKKKKAKKK